MVVVAAAALCLAVDSIRPLPRQTLQRSAMLPTSFFFNDTPPSPYLTSGTFCTVLLCEEFRDKVLTWLNAERKFDNMAVVMKITPPPPSPP